MMKAQQASDAAPGAIVMGSIRAWIFTIIATLCAIAKTSVAAPPSLDFNRDVRPILSAHCFKCHGPDESAREAGLRLDHREAATKQLDSGATAIVPSQPEKSELLRRIFSSNPDEIMPPPAANKALSADQKQLLKQWIAGGANYAPHWAFVPPRAAAILDFRFSILDSSSNPPSSNPKSKIQNLKSPIDVFIQTRLHAAGLLPAPEAPRHTLARRASLDLLGLPPTPEQADTFVNDASPDAYERLLDRLFSSPQYGERWARKWLDLARYADTNGYEKDRPRSIWPYRDWVIRALNADLPFDQFTIEQLAGDMLPGATQNQKIATGFHRNTMINEEGGIDPLEFRFYSSVDRINTTATIWLGLTLGCAQCHTHKFDPIPHHDYYRQLAFLNNADEPTIEVRNADIAAQRATIEGQIAELEAELPSKFPAAGNLTSAEHFAQKFQTWLAAQREKTVRWTQLKPLTAKSGVPTLTIQSDNSIFASGDMTKRDAYDIALDTSNLPGLTALRLEVLPDERLPKNGPGRIYYEGPPGDFWLSEITTFLPLPLGEGRGEGLKLTSPSHSHAANKNNSAAALDNDPQTGWSINGSQGRTHYAVFHFEKPLPASPQFELQLLFERYHAAGLGRFRLWATTDPRGGEARNFSQEMEELLLLPPDQLTTEQIHRLQTQFAQISPELAAERAKIKKLRDELPAYPTTLVMHERPPGQPRATFLHHRGEWLQAKDQVQPALLSIFPAPPANAPHDRLTYARWLVSPANPLVGRVTMNRHWASFFGTGLVRTTDDFGYQGEPPTHPDLLDWLALELPRRHWSIKTMHRLIASSHTYRQSSAEFLKTENRKLKTDPDPQNRLLSKFPRQRLEAETIRDSLLSVSGLLTQKLGGPSVFPPQPPGITTEGAYGPLTWTVSTGEDRYRRGLYTFAKRTAPFAMFATFDGPSGEACIARREVSNTPLQALTMLNNIVLLESAQALASDSCRVGSAHLSTLARSASEGSSLPLPLGEGRGEGLRAHISLLFHRILTRPPTDTELTLLTTYYKTQLHRLTTKQLDAPTIAAPGDGDPLPSAALTLLARSLLNLDEFITKE